MKFVKFLREKHPNELVLFLIFIVLFVVMAVMSPDVFLSGANLQNMIFQMPEFGLMALAMMAAVLTGGMNLSITNGAMFSAIIAALLMTTEWGKANPVPATIVGVIAIVGISILTGVFNGVMIGYIGMVAMLVTLSTRLVFEGVGLIITKGNSIGSLPEPFLAIGSLTVGPIPLTMVLFIIMIVVSYFMLERSKWGREVYMIGDNETATRFSGINTKKVLMLVYVFSGLLYGLSGVLITSRYCSAKTDYGTSYLMQSITAVVMGGTDINGGSGTVAGTILAVMILQTVSTGFTIHRVDQNLVNIFNGLILLAVLSIRYITGRVIATKKIRERQAEAKSQA